MSSELRTHQIGAGLGTFLTSYLKEKGKKLATKDDIADITTRVEDVKSVYLAEIEKLKNELARSLTVSKFQIEFEMTAYSEVCKALAELRFNYYKVMPNYFGADGEEKRTEFMRRFYSDLGKLQILMDEKAPFFEKNIKITAFKIMDMAWERATKSHISIGDAEMIRDFWKEEPEKKNAFFALNDQLYEDVRKRVEEMKKKNQS